MTDDPTRENFEHMSSEYAQALQAFAAIEQQAPTLLLLGHRDELRQFIDQFIAMATNAKEQAIEKDEPNFVTWFGELIQKAAQLRAGVPD